MANIQHALFSGGYLNENSSNDYSSLGLDYVNGLAGVPVPPTNVFIYAKTRIYFIEPYPDRWYYINRRARANIEGFIPQTPAPFADPKRRYAFKNVTIEPNNGVARQRASRAETSVVMYKPQPFADPQRRYAFRTVVLEPGRSAARQRAVHALTPLVPQVPLPWSSRARQLFKGPVQAPKLPKLRQRTSAFGSVPIGPMTVTFDAVVREVLVTDTSALSLDGMVREVLVHNSGPLVVDGIIREVLGMTPASTGPIPVFPTLPYGFPIKVRPVMATTIGSGTSDREVRVDLQKVPLWEIDLLFEELRDRGQNPTPYVPLAGFTEYQQLVQLWLSMYGQAGVFAFDAPWDDSREDQPIGTGDGLSYIFTIFRTWGQGTASITEPIGAVNQVFEVQVNGVTVPPTNYYTERNKIYFIDPGGFTHPPGNGLAITMTFSFYYLCRFVENSQDFEEFSKGRWTLSALKFQSVYWP